MWLRDALPYDLTGENTDRPMARVMVYGYESTVAQSRSIQNLEDLATSFHTSLLALTNAPIIRPVILIAHSLGGLIIKQFKRYTESCSLAFRMTAWTLAHSLRWSVTVRIAPLSILSAASIRRSSASNNGISTRRWGAKATRR
ncbi:hypothetical protein B0T25DRAFT_529581, partial [Lasiosphaeria hispida]